MLRELLRPSTARGGLLRDGLLGLVAQHERTVSANCVRRAYDVCLGGRLTAAHSSGQGSNVRRRRESQMYQSVLGHQASGQGSEPCWKDFTLHTLCSAQTDAGISNVLLEPQAGPTYYRGHAVGAWMRVPASPRRHRAAPSHAATGMAVPASAKSVLRRAKHLARCVVARLALATGLLATAGAICLLHGPGSVAARPMIDPLPPGMVNGIPSLVANHTSHATGSIVVTGTGQGVLTGSLSGAYTILFARATPVPGPTRLAGTATCRCVVSGHTGILTVLFTGTRSRPHTPWRAE